MFYIAIGIVLVILLLLYYICPKSLNTFKLAGSHVLITGGSSGIGKAVAIEVIKRGASVTIVARNKEKLLEAKQQLDELIRYPDKQKVNYFAMDVSRDYAMLKCAIHQAEIMCGPVDMLINSAGFSVSDQFEDIPVEEFKRMMETNYLGSVYATRAVIRGMKERKNGRIVFVSSQAGQLGLFGYSGYSATKFALRGFAETLQMEVCPYNIRVCVSFPPDTDTPGYQEELKTMPKETKMISSTSGIFKADQVAKAIVEDSLNGKFSSYNGLDGWMLSTLTCGMAPITSVFDGFQQVMLMGLLRLIASFYLFSFYGIVKKCQGDRSAHAKLHSDKDE